VQALSAAQLTLELLCPPVGGSELIAQRRELHLARRQFASI